MKTGEIVTKLMKEHGIKKQTDLARIIYQKDKIEPKERVNLSGYLIGSVNFPDFALERIATHFGVTIDFLKGREEEKEVKAVPIVANTSCGACDVSTLQDFNKKSYVSRRNWKKSLYSLIACGDSMSSEINDGDELIVDPEIKPANGDIVHYKIDDESAVKVLVIDNEAHIMQFVPINSTDNFKTKTIRLDDEDTLNRLEVHKVISIIKTKVNNRAARLKMIGR